MVRTATPRIESLIDRQIRLWEVRRRLAEEGGEVAKRELVHLRFGPWLTVSRQVGAGGTALAERIAHAAGLTDDARDRLAEAARAARPAG